MFTPARSKYSRIENQSTSNLLGRQTLAPLFHDTDEFDNPTDIRTRRKSLEVTTTPHSQRTMARIESRKEMTPLTASPPANTIFEKAISSLRRHRRNSSMPLPIHANETSTRSDCRLVDREGAFFQSKGKMKIHRRIKQSDWASFYYGDLFHSIVDAPTSRVLFGLIFIYIFLVICFAFIYYFISVIYDCNMGILNFQEAFVFSLETMATIGYGTQDIFFGDCWLPTVVLAAQVSVKLVAEAVTIGIIYSRIARPSKRATTIVFSRYAVIRRIRGKLYFMFQLCELRKHQLVEAHVRLYCIRHERDVDGQPVAAFQSCSMRLNHPNDELGGMLLMCLPQVVVHEIDCTSPLMPPPLWASATARHVWHPPAMEHCIQRLEGGRGLGYDMDALSSFPGVLRRSANNPLDSPYRLRHSMGREQSLATYSSPLAPSLADGERDRRHVSKSMSGSGSADGAASDSSEGDKPPSLKATDWQLEEKDMITKYMRDRRVEILAIVEGMDAATGGVMQSRYSFKCCDIKWNQSFAPCVQEDVDGTAIVDFSQFHVLVDAPIDAPAMYEAASII